MKANPSVVVNSQAPEFIRTDYAKFITFLQKYYQYLESSGNALDIIRNLDTFNDIDVQEDPEILSIFYTLFLPDFPQSIKADKKFVLKNIAEFYNSKGSIDSIKAFFRMFYGEEVDIYLPKIDILKLDAGIWNKVFKIKVQNLSAGTIPDLLGSEVYQIDQVNGNKTVRARVIDYSPDEGTLFLTADNIILNFDALHLVYAVNKNGLSITFGLQTQLGEVVTYDGGQNYEVSDRALLLNTESNTEDLRVQQVKTGQVENVIILDQGDEYSIFDEVTFTPTVDGERPAKAIITRTINKDLVSELNDVNLVDPDDKFLYEDESELRQEYGSFGSQQSTPNNTLTDETYSNVNTGSISSNEFGFLTEQQNDDTIVYSRGSYTYNQGLYRPLIPRVGSTANYMLNYARSEGISVVLNDEDLIIGSINCDTGTPPDPGTVIIVFDTEADYVALDRWELTERTVNTATAPVVGTVNSRKESQVILDSKIGGLTVQQQIGLYDLGQDTLSPLYPFCENSDSIQASQVLYIRERNTLHGHDLSTTRPWEYRFIFKKNTTVRCKIYIMPVQYDLRSGKLLDEDGSDYVNESDDTCIIMQEQYDPTVNRVVFNPANVTDNTILVPNHGFKQYEIIRYESFVDIETGFESSLMGGVTHYELFYCDVIDSNNIKLIPYGSNNEKVNYKLYRDLTAAGPGTYAYFASFVGSHVTNGVDYTSTDIEESAISIYAKRKIGGNRDFSLKYNVDPLVPTDADTGSKSQYPYTVDNKVYIFEAINEFTEYIKMERDVFEGSDAVALQQEIDKRTPIEAENYETYPYIALENSATSVIQDNDEILIPEFSNARVFVERKAIQTVDDINRGQQRLQKSWNDYADISPSQELYCLAQTIYDDEYSQRAYNTAVLPPETSTYVSGPGEFANVGSNILVAASKNNSVYYTDGLGLGNYKYSSEFLEQRRISFVETPYHDSFPQYPTARNGPLGITEGSQSAYNTNSKRYYTINFTLPEELNVNFDNPFEVNLTNIIDSCNFEGTFSDVDFYDYFTLEGAPFPTSDVLYLENGEYLGAEFNKFGYKSLANGKLSNNHPNVMLEFFSPSMLPDNPKKHLIFYANKAEYLRISSDVQRTVYSFFNCWSPTGAIIPDTNTRDYTVVVRSLVKSDFILEKISDTQLLTGDPEQAVVNNVYVSPFVKDIFIKKGINDYGKYIKMYSTYEDSIAETNELVPFSLGQDFGSHINGNELFYNPISSGTLINSAYNNPLAGVNVKSPFHGLFQERNISIARYFDPINDVGTDGNGDSIIIIANHNFVSGSWVRFRADFNATTPLGLVDGTTYYIQADNNAFIKLAASKEDYDNEVWVVFTAGVESGKTCSLQTVPQSLTYSGIKENSFDTKQYVESVVISGIDTNDGTLFTTVDNTLSTLNPVTYRNVGGTAIGGLVSDKQYFAIYLSANAIRLAQTQSDAVSGIFIPLTSAGSGTHYIDVNGSNGNLLYNASTMEQTLYTPGQYTNNLKTGDQVTYRGQRKIDSTTSNGDTMYVKGATTGATESYTLTHNSDLSTTHFGVVTGTVDLGTNTITSANHVFYTGEEVYYGGTTGVSLNVPSVCYVIRVDNSNFKLAASFTEAIVGEEIDITLGSGNHYFSRTNKDTSSEIMEVVPYSTEPNLGGVINPGVTGTGYEEFTIIFATNLITETGKIANVAITDPGSYYTAPETTITTYGNRTGAGADILPIMSKSTGRITSFEILNGGLHNANRTLNLPYSFLSETITGTFETGEPIKLLSNDTKVGTLQSKKGHYFKIAQDGDGDLITETDTIVGMTSGATATVGRTIIVTDITPSANCEITTDGFHYLGRGDRVYIDCAAPVLSGTFYALPTATNKFRIFDDREFLLPVNNAGGATYGGTAIVRTGLFTASAQALPKAFTLSTENGSTSNYSGDKNLLNTTTVLQDSYYYQDYSYVVRGSNSHDDWKPYFNKLVHPAGMAVFGEVDYFTESEANNKLGNTLATNGLINNTSVAITTELVTSSGLIDTVDNGASTTTVFEEIYDARISTSTYATGDDALIDAGNASGTL